MINKQLIKKYISMKHISLIAFILILFISKGHSQQHFTDIANSYGISGQNGLGHAVGWGDIDNDGLMDVGFSNQEGTEVWFYHNDSTGFTEITASAGLAGLSADKIIFADISGDYYPELLLTTRSGDAKIFLNNGDGTFSDITGSAGVYNRMFAAADFNNDGNLDLFVLSSGASIAYINNGDMSFTPSTIAPFSSSFSSAVACLDYNNDSFTDIYISYAGDGLSHLLRNNGDLSFTDVTNEAGVGFNADNNAVTVGDYNNDGWTDIYVGSYDNGKSCKLYKNNGDETFSDVTYETGTQGHKDTRTVSFVDYNNDGFLDIFSSHHDFYTYSNTLLRNNGDNTFTDVASSLGISGEWIGDYFGVGWADFNNDGDMDLFAAGHIDKYNLFRNDECPNNSFILNLRGVNSNKNAIGTKVELWNNENLVSRTIVAGQGAHDSHSTRLHFGLGENTSFDSLKIYWSSGLVKKFDSLDITINSVNTISEDDIPTAISTEFTMDISVFPNPTSEKLFLKADNQLIEKTQLISVNGSLCPEIKLERNNMLNLSGLKRGVYFIKIYTDENIIVKKIIKN